jgi:sulfate transport system permease protein
MQLRHHSVLPGFGLTMGFTLLYLSLLVLIPLAALFVQSASMDWEHFWAAVSNEEAVAAYRLSFGAALVGATLNGGFGLVVAWVLVRYTFPGKSFVDAIVDLPFALPTAVSGITLAWVYGPSGWIGRWLEAAGISVVNRSLGVTVALTFIGLPFVTRTLQPALEDLEPELEEAAASLGASRWQTFRRVILPTILPALLTGFAMALARGLGEYGSVIFIASGIPGEGEIAPMVIAKKLAAVNAQGTAEACAIAVVMLAASFALLLAINLLQWRSRRHTAGV